MNEAGHIPLVLQTVLEYLELVVQILVGLGNGAQGHLLAVVLEVLQEEHGMVPLLLGLNLVPVGKAIQTNLVIVQGKVQVQVGGIELLVDLIVEQLRNFLIQHNNIVSFI